MAALTYYHPAWYQPTLAADSDRERTVELLRGHWNDGRLTLEDFEARCQDAFNARYVSDLWWAVRELPVTPTAPVRRVDAADPKHGTAVTSVVLSSIGLGLFLLSFSFLALFSLPLSAAGWVTGRNARRAASRDRTRSAATTGEVLGIIGTAFACLALAAFSVIVWG